MLIAVPSPLCRAWRPSRSYSPTRFLRSATLLELLAARPAWHADAACREAPAEVTWFLKAGHEALPAKLVCSECLVVAECRAWALSQGPELEGVWGGLSRAERAIERRALRMATPAA